MDVGTIKNHGWCYFEDSSPFSIVSLEIWVRIFSFLPDISQEALEKSCRTFRAILIDKPFFRRSSTAFHAQYGKLVPISFLSIPATICFATPHEVTLMRDHGSMQFLIKVCRDNKTMTESKKGVLYGIRELHFKDCSLFFSSFTYLLYNHQLKTWKIFDPIRRPFVFFATTETTTRLVSFSFFLENIQVTQFKIQDGIEFCEEWTVDCGPLSGAGSFWSTNDKEIFCIRKCKSIYQLTMNPPGNIQLPLPYDENTIQYIMPAGEFLLFLFNDQHLACCEYKGATLKFSQIWENAMKQVDFDQIVSAKVYDGNLCIVFAKYHAVGDSLKTLILCVLDVTSGTLLFQKELRKEEVWKVRGSILLTYIPFSFLGYDVHHLRTKKTFHQTLESSLAVQSMEIEHHSGAILMTLLDRGQCTLYEQKIPCEKK